MATKTTKPEMIERTNHGDNIANQIQEEDAYGEFNSLNAADVWNILDQMQTHFIDIGNNELTTILGQWLRQIEDTFPVETM